MEFGVVVFVLTLPFVAESIHFEVESGHIKCMGEDIKIDSMTVGHYSIVNPNQGHPLPPHHKINVSVYTPKGDRLHYAEVVESGQFAFGAEEDGNHLACISAIDHQPEDKIFVEFDWRSGVATKQWSNVAKKGSVDAMELELKKLADTIASIQEEMFALRLRNLEMMMINRNTNSRMGYLSLVSLFLCLSVAALQLWHLKSFFQKKKII
ncbi:transmembrane emp24 domain-containing protein p24delta9-like [Cynara cardunculus var. scolymus]|uniref:GOLD-like protein n=1 Tax=Cynara cardunculus var. scolymus TaxID=59895 RepID=A0A103XSN2_CYNCS|nr:transmembrane emp24 domain-containing protein p24delta9-like [Cynara cardunculus var. scolymus]KVH96167.1 GOLD-like protein [Cynara cardunculus var. scolymus]